MSVRHASDDRATRRDEYLRSPAACASSKSSCPASECCKGCAATDRNTHAGIARQLVDKRNELGAGATIVVGDCNPFASNGASEGSFESNLADRGIPLVYVGTGAFGGYGYLDKIFATSEWTKIDAGDRGTGGSDHPAISASLRL